MQRMLDHYTVSSEEFFKQPQIRTGSPQAAYLISRGIDSWQEVSGLRAASYEGHPAIIALVQMGDWAKSCQYTVLDPKGKSRRFLKGTSPKHGAIRLINRGYNHLFVSEGVETALSHWILKGKPPQASYWAGMSCGNLEKLKLPTKDVGQLTILYDKDRGGQGLKAAQTLEKRAKGLGWEASLSEPPNVEYGDWNDELQLFLKENNNGKTTPYRAAYPTASSVSV